MQYLKKGFAEKGMGMFGLILAGVFAFLCIGGSFGGGNMVQANQACEQLVGVVGEGSFLDENRWAFGLIMAVAVGLVIIGGIKSIASVTATLVPFMCGIYMLAGLFVILVNFGQIGVALGVIFEGAFNRHWRWHHWGYDSGYEAGYIFQRSWNWFGPDCALGGENKVCCK